MEKQNRTDLIPARSQIDAEYLRAAALEAGDKEAARIYENESQAWLQRNLEDEAMEG